MHTTRKTIHIAEEGEAIGTLSQFSSMFNLPRSTVLHCIKKNAGSAVILQPNDNHDMILIMDKVGLQVIRDCAWQPSVATPR